MTRTDDCVFGDMKTVEWVHNKVRIIDQTRLPLEEVFVEYDDYRDVALAIKTMKVRGAPAIGVTAAFGVALAAFSASREKFAEELSEACDVLGSTRPTAVNLFWAIDRMRKVISEHRDDGVDQIQALLLKEALLISDSDEDMCRRMGVHGNTLISDGARILTHWNAGALAAVSLGTALAPIRIAHQEGKGVHVYVTETRPLLQGSRLTAWELMRDNIPMTLITDSMAGYFMMKGEIDLVLVGSDRIVANGDFANKIGTYMLAVLAGENNIPLYAVAPTSTFDDRIMSGEDIMIEERDHSEVISINEHLIAPHNTPVRNPAFDVTPHRYLSGIVCEQGILYPPFEKAIAKALQK